MDPRATAGFTVADNHAFKIHGCLLTDWQSQVFDPRLSSPQLAATTCMAHGCLHTGWLNVNSP